MRKNCSTRLGREHPEAGQLAKNAIDLEQQSDVLIAQLPPDGNKTYTERQLARKIRLEERRWPEVGVASVPSAAMDYLLCKQIRLLLDSSELSKLQAVVLALAVEGWRITEIAEGLDVPYRTAARALRIARARVAGRRSSPYDGLHEVYWSGVNRYIYKKPRKSG